MQRIRLIFGLVFILYCTEAFSQIYINEIQAYNASSYLERWWGNFPDWIELYNGGKKIVDLDGYFITDDINIPAKWELTSQIIYPGGCGIIYADKVAYHSHTNFSLDGSGEQILLYSPELVLIDSINFGTQYPDISYGRYPDGTQNWTFFEENTPLKANSPNHMTQPSFAEKAHFSQEGGFNTGSQTISISTTSPTAVIRFTTDGSDPNAESSIYSDPLMITTTTVIRAKVFEEGVFSSTIVTHTYFIDKEISLPVVSISINSSYLWDDMAGIYVVGTNGLLHHCSEVPANYFQDWERPINIEYFDQNGKPGFNQMAGTKIFGACSRRAKQKSMSIFARGKYGKKEFDYKLFEDKDLDEFKSFVIRNSGNDIRHTMLRDGMMQTLVKDQMDVDYQEYQPAIVYINGDYWGILNIREKINEDYLEANHGVDAESVDILTGHVAVVEGTDSHYQQLMDFVRSNNLSDPVHYDYVNSQIDIDEYLNYQIAQIYFFNQDWPQGNIKYWRPQTPDGRWRWLLYDLDFGFDYDQYHDNMVEWATMESQNSTELFRELLSSKKFRNEFLQRFCSHMNTTFQPDRVISIIDSLAGNINTEMPDHIDRFYWPGSMSKWYDKLGVLTNFAGNRLPVLTENLMHEFDLEGTCELSTQVSDRFHGSLQICGVDVPAQFSGLYFQNLPLTIRAVPTEGWTFLGWQGASKSVNSVIELTLSEDASITALFGPAETKTNISFNELSSNNENAIQDESGQMVDWIEFYNTGTDPINMAGLYLTDSIADLTKYRVPFSSKGSTILYPDSTIVFYADNDPSDGPLHLNFKLSNKGENIVLSQMIENKPVIIDTVCYAGQAPGSTVGKLPDGTGGWQLTLPSPGNTNQSFPMLSGLYINEFSASNKSIIKDNYGEYDDWIEIYNDNDVPIDVGGLFVTDSLPDGRKYRISSLYPDSTTIQAKDYLILWADNQEEQGVLHLGFGLKREGEQLGLLQYNGIDFIDSLSYEEQFTNTSISYFSESDGQWVHVLPTPGKRNDYPAVSGLYINEFSASNKSIIKDNYGEYDDWIEIYNDNDVPINVGGLFVTDSLHDGRKYRISSLYPDSTTIQAKDYLILWADKQEEQGVLHLGFGLKRGGEQIGLLQYNGIDFIDSLTYCEIAPNSALSRYPDGNLTWLLLNSTPGSENINDLYYRLCINEFRAGDPVEYSTGQFEDGNWVELFNCSEYDIDIGGLYMTNDLSYPNKYWIPDSSSQETTIPPKGFLLMWSDNRDDEGVLHMNFILNQQGNQIGLARKVNDEYFYIDSLVYSYQNSRVSTGRINDGVNSWRDFSDPTPGQSNSNSITTTPAMEVMNFNVYPNPVSNGILHFNYSRSVELYNISGFLVKKKINTSHLNVSFLPPGIYILKTQKGEVIRIVII